MLWDWFPLLNPYFFGGDERWGGARLKKKGVMDFKGLARWQGWPWDWNGLNLWVNVGKYTLELPPTQDSSHHQD